MLLHPNNVLLIDTLESMPLLDGRFANIRWINRNAAGQRRGCFSLVFRADDVAQQKTVALKFFDLHPRYTLDKYRADAFTRENDILTQLLNADRCLQLVKSLSVFELPVPGSLPVCALGCRYFSVEWLENDIDAYFLDGGAGCPVDKLRLFNEIVLAVEALHRREIFHRDLKADNLRESTLALKHAVVAIDLGTAARFDSGYLQCGYGAPVGAPGYAAPEALCGLAGNRRLAPYTDVFALGCLLFELFNRDYFFRAFRAINRDFDARIVAMSQRVTDRSSEKKQVDQWRTAVAQFSPGVAAVPIDGPGSVVPPGVAPILGDVLARMTNINFEARAMGLPWFRKRIASAIRVLENERSYQARLRYVREYRRRKIERAKAISDRLNAFKAARKDNLC